MTEHPKDCDVCLALDAGGEGVDMPILNGLYDIAPQTLDEYDRSLADFDRRYQFSTRVHIGRHEFDKENVRRHLEGGRRHVERLWADAGGRREGLGKRPARGKEWRDGPKANPPGL